MVLAKSTKRSNPVSFSRKKVEPARSFASAASGSSDVLFSCSMLEISVSHNTPLAVFVLLFKTPSAVLLCRFERLEFI